TLGQPGRLNGLLQLGKGVEAFPLELFGDPGVPMSEAIGTSSLIRSVFQGSIKPLPLQAEIPDGVRANDKMSLVDDAKTWARLIRR
ncbi:MAG: hypothetical protein QHH07_08645, partial [Sedimentisphaerales bacterium]|nr:hypothetical protein [Sedimentisphaerales bacterium]